VRSGKAVVRTAGEHADGHLLFKTIHHLHSPVNYKNKFWQNKKFITPDA